MKHGEKMMIVTANLKEGSIEERYQKQPEMFDPVVKIDVEMLEQGKSVVLSRLLFLVLYFE